MSFLFDVTYDNDYGGDNDDDGVAVSDSEQQQRLCQPLLSPISNNSNNNSNKPKTGSSKTRVRQHLINDDNKNSTAEASGRTQNFCCSNTTISSILSVLMFLQFGIAFCTLNHEALANIPPWSTVNLILLLFVITSVVYRKSIHEVKNMRATISASETGPTKKRITKDSETEERSSKRNKKTIFDLPIVPVLLLLPELTMDIVLGLVQFHKVEIAFYLVLGIEFFMTIVVSMNCIFMLILRYPYLKSKKRQYELLVFFRKNFTEDELDISDADALLGYLEESENDFV